MAKFLNYDLYDAYCSGVQERPLEDVKQLGIKVLHAVPQRISNSLWLYVEDYDVELPGYITPREPYNLNYWRDRCLDNCEYFQKYHETHHDEYCCWGGVRCLKGKESGGETDGKQ